MVDVDYGRVFGGVAKESSGRARGARGPLGAHEKVRAHLLESNEGARQTALAEAEKAKGWEERERLRRAAEKANTEILFPLMSWPRPSPQSRARPSRAPSLMK